MAIKVLCVTDEQSIQNQFSQLFSDQDGYEVLFARSATEGLNLLKKEDGIRLVFANYRLSGTDGSAFLKHIKTEWPGAFCFLLAVEGDACVEGTLLDLGDIDRFISLPWVKEDLILSMTSALRHQDLQHENLKLATDLIKKNEELRRVNESLEAVVAKRTEALEIRNHVLQISQGILDVLPVAVFGVDPEQLIVHCNEYARDLFPYGIMGPLGNDRYDVFSADVNRLIDRLEFERNPEALIELKGRNYNGVVKRVHESLAQGVVLVLVPLD